MYQNRYHNGVVVRPVYYHGKMWQEHRITEGPRKGRSFVTVYKQAGAQWPTYVS